MIQAYGTDTPTPADNAMQCFRPGWNGDSNASRECNSILQAWMERRLHPRKQNNTSKTGWNAVQRLQQTKQFFRPGWNAGSNGISRQSNASGLDGMQAPTASADKAMLQAWIECRLQSQQTKKCFRSGWNGDSITST